jgi:hypothetical protein
MKKEFIILFILFLPIVSAWDHQIEAECENCFEGEFANITLQILNDEGSDLNVYGVYLMDGENIDFFYSKTNQTLNADESKSFLLSVQLPPPTRSETLFFKPCLLTDIGKSCAVVNSRLRVRPISQIECLDDSGCKDGSDCVFNKCVKIKSNFGWFILGGILILVLIVIIIKIIPKKQSKIKF